MYTTLAASREIKKKKKKKEKKRKEEYITFAASRDIPQRLLHHTCSKEKYVTKNAKPHWHSCSKQRGFTKILHTLAASRSMSQRIFHLTCILAASKESHKEYLTTLAPSRELRKGYYTILETRREISQRKPHHTCCEKRDLKKNSAPYLLREKKSENKTK